MLSRDSNPTTTHTFTVTVEIAEGESSPEAVSLKLADALTWVEGVGEVDVVYLGALDSWAVIDVKDGD